MNDEHIWLIRPPVEPLFFFNLVSYTVCTYSIYLSVAFFFVQTVQRDIRGAGGDFPVETNHG